MKKARKCDPQGRSTPPEWAGKEALAIAEASANAARSPRSDAAAARALAQLGARLGSAAPQAPGPSDPKRRSFPDPGTRAEASARAAPPARALQGSLRRSGLAFPGSPARRRPRTR